MSEIKESILWEDHRKHHRNDGGGYDGTAWRRQKMTAFSFTASNRKHELLTPQRFRMKGNNSRDAYVKIFAIYVMVDKTIE